MPSAPAPLPFTSEYIGSTVSTLDHADPRIPILESVLHACLSYMVGIPPPKRAAELSIVPATSFHFPIGT